MTRYSRHAIVSGSIAFLAVVALLPAGAAQAQWYSSVSRQPQPLYPYSVDTRQPYAVEVAPNTYVIRRPGEKREAAYGRRGARVIHVPDTKIARAKTDPALIEELRSARKPKHAVMHTTKVVRDKPVVVEHKRYIDDPPRVVERYTVVDDNKPVRGNAAVSHKPDKKGDEKRVIRADAEITILGPDRMNIRLFRKGSGGKANASVE